MLAVATLPRELLHLCGMPVTVLTGQESDFLHCLLLFLTDPESHNRRHI